MVNFPTPPPTAERKDINQELLVMIKSNKQLIFEQNILIESLRLKVRKLETHLQAELQSQAEINDLIQKIIIKQHLTPPNKPLQHHSVLPAVESPQEERQEFYARRLIEAYRRKYPEI